MAVSSEQAAFDEIFGLLHTNWSSGTTAIVGYIPEIRWVGDGVRDIPETSKYWCRVSTQNIDEIQTTINENAENNKRRYTNFGILFIQLFAPRSDATAVEKGLQLAELIKNIFRGRNTSTGIWFRNVVIKPLPEEENWYRFNIIARYEFDQIA
jgi:hypothetical protein